MSKLAKLFESLLYKEYTDYLEKHKKEEKVNVEIIGNGTVIMKEESLNDALSKIDEHEVNKALERSREKLELLNHLKKDKESFS